MKRVLVNDAAANMIGDLRNSNGSYESVKSQIADCMCKMAGMLNEGRYGADDNVLKFYVNDVIDAMCLVADYNEFLDNLFDSNDKRLSRYVLEKPEEDNDKRRYDYAPSEKELEYVEKIMGEEKIELLGLLKLDELTFREIADTIGMSEKDLFLRVNHLRFCQKSDSQIKMTHSSVPHPTGQANRT